MLVQIRLRFVFVDLPPMSTYHVLTMAVAGKGVRVDRRSGEGAGGVPGFFLLWKDADPNIPILVAAKAEYAKLQ